MGDEYKPKLKEWRLCFFGIDGYDNRKDVAGTIGKFYQDRDSDVCLISGVVRINGKIFDCDENPDGTQYETPPVRTIERIERNNDGPNILDLFHATCVDEKGVKSEYYFNTECTPMTLMLLKDAANGDLKEFPYFYIEGDLKGKGYI